MDLDLTAGPHMRRVKACVVAMAAAGCALASQEPGALTVPGRAGPCRVEIWSHPDPTFVWNLEGRRYLVATFDSAGTPRRLQLQQPMGTALATGQRQYFITWAGERSGGMVGLVNDTLGIETRQATASELTEARALMVWLWEHRCRDPRFDALSAPRSDTTAGHQRP
jgi:hypothetical protein